MTDAIQGTKVHFGGPDLPPRALRDLLEARIEAVPSGGHIAWATYYFRDRGLAATLVRARRRGVDVRLAVEAIPRQRTANERVMEILRGDDGLGGGLREVSDSLGAIVGAHLHSKIYAFSHPHPCVLVGSFNPSGDSPEEDPELIKVIGDQDRGHNLLVENFDPLLVAPLRAHVLRLCTSAQPGAVRFSPGCQRAIHGNNARAWLFPRLRPRIVDRLLGSVGAGQRLRVAMSHLKHDLGLRAICTAARRGARVQVVLHHTERRAPKKTEDALLAAGVEVFRYRHPDALPMHAKFILADGGGATLSTYGSLNLNPRSLLANHEIFLGDRNPEVFSALDGRWQQIENECREHAEEAADSDR
jgi:phosphatidylserine/phosphatidylglycerophosphate/cardiolipin synthase-like enzyme